MHLDFILFDRGGCSTAVNILGEHVLCHMSVGCAVCAGMKLID